MMKKALLTSVVVALSTLPNSALALNDWTLSQLKGWTVIETSPVRGTFDGCEYDKPIALDNGWVLFCQSYGYSYAYRPTAVVFGKGITANSVRQVKALINGELYDMQPIQP
jgi:hypothetical protein